MGLTYEGEIDSVSEAQLNFLSDVIIKRGFTDAKVSIHVLGVAGDNYAANVKRIIVQNGNEELRIVGKFAPTLELVRAANQIGYLFINEHIVYTQLMPKFQELEEKAGVPKEDRLRFPECYGTYINAPNEMILLEDLQVPGFNMLNRFKPLSEDCIKSVLKNFSIFHSLSYALRYNEYDTFKEFKKKIYDPWVNIDINAIGNLKNFIADIENKAVMVASDEKAKELLKGCVFTTLAETIAMKDEVESSKHSVIVQADGWTNNILFKFNGDELEQSILIDYQLVKFTYPTYDLMYFLLNCTDHEDRLQNFYHWLDYYHSELDKSLHYHGLKADDVYPRDQIDICMKKHGKTILGISVMLACLSLLKPEEATKVKEAMESHEFEEVNELTNYNQEFMALFKKKVTEILDTLLHFDLL